MANQQVTSFKLLSVRKSALLKIFRATGLGFGWVSSFNFQVIEITVTAVLVVEMFMFLTFTLRAVVVAQVVAHRTTD